MTHQDLPLFALIPPDQPEWQQVSDLMEGRVLQTCKLLRDPLSIDEFERYKNVAVWMSNGSFVLIHIDFDDDGDDGDLLDRTEEENEHVSLTFESEAIIETASFFASLKCSENGEDSVLFVSYHIEVSHCISSLVQHALALEAKPPRQLLIISDVPLTTEVAAIIATQPHPIDLDADSYYFEDGGDAFIDYLQSRQNSFGRLSLDRTTLTDFNLRRLCDDLSLFEKLEFPEMPSDLLLKAFSAPMQFMGCIIDDENAATDLSSIDIAPKEVSVLLSCSCSAFPTTAVLSLFRNLAASRHLERLVFYLYCGHLVPREVARELINMLKNSSKLRRLELLCFQGKWDGYMQEILACLEDSLCLEYLTLEVNQYPTNLDPDFSWVKKLLKQNRTIKVVDRNDDAWSDGGEIDAIYAFNRFFCGSESLQHEAPSTRPSLFVEALSQYASNNLQHSASLLSHHVDELCNGLLHQMEGEDK